MPISPQSSNFAPSNNRKFGGDFLLSHFYVNGGFDLSSYSYFDSIYFAYNDLSLYPIKLEVIYPYAYDPGFYPEYTVDLELVDSDGVLLGGEMFQFKNDRPELSNEIIRPVYTQSPRRAVNHQMDMNKRPLHIDVYTIQGQHLSHYENTAVDEIKFPHGVYILNVQYDNQSNQLKIIK